MQTVNSFKDELASKRNKVKGAEINGSDAPTDVKNPVNLKYFYI